MTATCGFSAGSFQWKRCLAKSAAAAVYIMSIVFNYPVSPSYHIITDVDILYAQPDHKTQLALPFSYLLVKTEANLLFSK